MVEYLSAAEWASQVEPTEPHGLADTDRVVLERADSTLARAYRERLKAQDPIERWIRTVGTPVVMVALLAGPIAAATAFMDVDRGTWSFDFGDDFAYPAAAVGSLFGIILQCMALKNWWRGRRRDWFGFWVSVGLLVCAMMTLLLGYRGGEYLPLPVSVYLAPAWISAVVSVVAILAMGLASKPRPAAGAEIQGVDISTLSDQAVADLLDDRRRAMEILQLRGLLPDIDIARYNERPLGQLADTHSG